MARLKFSARVYVDKLKLDNRQSVHVIPCPFHSDEMPSLSINLDKAVFYCHGACAAPKGGGPLQFLLKWARYVDKKPITPIEARAQLRFSHKLIDAKAYRIEQMRKEVMLFVGYIIPTLADRTKFIERAIADVNAYAAARPRDVDEEVWTLLVVCHRELTWSEHAFQICIA